MEPRTCLVSITELHPSTSLVDSRQGLYHQDTCTALIYAGCFTSSLSLTPLRQSLALNLELGWQSVRPRDLSWVYSLTIPCFLHECWRFGLSSSYLHIKNSYPATSPAPTVLILLILIMNHHAVFFSATEPFYIPNTFTKTVISPEEPSFMFQFNALRFQFQFPLLQPTLNSSSGQNIFGD